MQNQTMPPILNVIFNDDRDFVLYLLQSDPFALRDNFNNLQDDLDFAFAAVECKAVVLPFLSERLQGHFKLVQKAIEYHPWTLIFASEKLRKRSYFQEILMKRDPEIFLCQSPEHILSTLLKIEISQVEEIHLFHCGIDHNYFKTLPQSLQLNEDFVLKAIDVNFHIFQHLPNQLKTNEDFIKIAFSRKNDIYRYLPEYLKNDQAITMIALQKNIKNHKYIPITLRKSDQFIYDLLMMDGSKIFKYDQLKNHKDFVKVAMQQNPNVFLKLPDQLKQDEDIIYLFSDFINLEALNLSMNQKLDMVELNPLNLKYFKDLQNDQAIVKNAIAKNELACLYASDNLLTSAMINALDQYIHHEFILNDVSHDIEKIKIIFQIIYAIEKKRYPHQSPQYSNQYQNIINAISNQYPNIYHYHFQFESDLDCNIIPQTSFDNNHHAVYLKSHDDLQCKILLFKQNLASVNRTYLSKEEIEAIKPKSYGREILKINQQQKIEISLTQSFGPYTQEMADLVKMSRFKSKRRRQ